MQELLTNVEIRILGCLIEKELTTPEYYPLTLNSLKTACNQKSNRHPVMTLDEKSLARGLDHLRQLKLIWQVSTAGSRAVKFEHRITAIGELTEKEIAVLCILMLRGPQTAGEIRTRSARLFEFGSPAEVLNVLEALADREDFPMVAELPLQPGRREPRYAHLLAGDPEPDEVTDSTPVPTGALREVQEENQRIEALEEQVKNLSRELVDLKEEFVKFKREFE